jgi:hypothetical protein
MVYASDAFVDTITVYEDLFEAEEPIYLSLKFDIKTYQRTRSKEEYLPAELSYRINDSLYIMHKVRIRARGNFRKSYCALPPFWLNIKNAGIDADVLEDVKKMKLVTHCKKSKIFSDYVLKEYLVYKLYNLLTPYSFRVRLIRMKYIDTGRDNKVTENWAFIIEPEELVAERLDARFIENDRLSMSRVNRDIMDRLALFQYMIGNGDYSVTGRHNLKIILLNNPGPTGYIPIPYDFDYTGFVNASYAIPGENLGIKSVRERYFLGPCRGQNLHQLVVDEMNGRKREILDYLQPFEYLTIKQKMEVLTYIESYFTEAASSRFVQRSIESTCR